MAKFDKADEKTQQLVAALKLVGNSITKEDFVRLTTHIVAFLKAAKVAINGSIERFKEEYEKKVKGLREDVSQATSRIGTLEKTTRALSEVEGRLNKKIEKVTASLPAEFDPSHLSERIEEVARTIPEIQTGEDYRNALEALPDGEKLVIAAIQGLQEVLDELRTKKPDGGPIIGGTMSLASGHWPRHEAFTMNGSDTSVTLAEGVGAVGTACIVRYQGQSLDLGSQYTVDGNKITFVDFVPLNDTIISVTYWP